MARTTWRAPAGEGRRHTGGADYEDAGQSPVEEQREEAFRVDDLRHEAFGAPSARRVWPPSPTAIRAGCQRARLASTARPTARARGAESDLGRASRPANRDQARGVRPI
jgi:hypothetical protein